jgi:DNA-binding transcriptional LysR family regulator
VALGRLVLAEQSLREGRLVALFGPPTSAGRGFHALFSPHAREKEEARAFVEWLREEIRRDAAEPGAFAADAVRRPRAKR